MLKTRIVPTLLMKGVGLVKGVGFDSWRRVGAALRWFRGRRHGHGPCLTAATQQFIFAVKAN